MISFIDEYNKCFVERHFTRFELFERLQESYGIEKALYFGSYIHITPSLVIPKVVYVDSFKKTKKLIESQEAANFIANSKKYSEKAEFSFIEQDYTKPLNVDSDFDLLISQYCGFASQAGKKYLKSGGVLVANNSHGDASMAYLDEDFELIAIANNTKDKWRLSKENLESYFIPKKGKHPTKVEVEKSGRGVGYMKSASNYVFKKIA